MRRTVILTMVFAALAAAAPARGADVEPMLIPGSGPGPILADGFVVWGNQSGRRVTVSSRPVAGGPQRIIAQTRVIPDDRTLAGGTGTGVLLWSGYGKKERTLYGPPSGPLVPVKVRSLADVVTGNLVPTQAGILRPPGSVADARKAVLTQPPGRHRVINLPREIEGLSTIATGGRFLAGITLPGQVVVVDLASGDKQRVIDNPGDGGVDKLAVGLDGSVAAVTGKKTVLAGPTATTFTVLRRSRGVTALALDGTRIAQATLSGPRDAARVEVFDVKTPQRTLSRGPLIDEPKGLELEGDAVAYRAEGCGIVANAVGGDTSALMPAGPCVRTQVSVGMLKGRRQGRDRSVVTVPVACLDGPGGRCRIRATVNVQGYTPASLRRVGKVAATVATGQSRTLRLRVRGRLARRVASDRFRLWARVRVTDPDGKTWAQGD